MTHLTSPLMLWRLAGGFALAHVVLFLAAAAITGQPTVHPGQQGIEHSFNEGSFARVVSGGYLLVLGFLALVPVAVFLARNLGTGSPAGRWAAQTAGAAALAFVVVITGAGFSAGAAALWARDHGLDLETVLAINNIRNFAYFLALPLAGTFALGSGIAALTDRTFVHWIGWGGIGVGLALVIAIPAAAVGIQYGMPVFLLWLTGTGITLLRHRPQPAGVDAVPATVAAIPSPAAPHR